MLEIGFVFAFIGRQLGRVLSLAFNWATTLLFGRVPQNRQLYLSGMARGLPAGAVVVLATSCGVGAVGDGGRCGAGRVDTGRERLPLVREAAQWCIAAYFAP